MTSEQLDEIEKLAEAATPGPYQVASIYPAYGVFRVQVDEPSECVAMCAVSMNEDADEAHVERQEAHARNGANARAIASLLRYALPLVKALREAWAVIDHYERKDGPIFQAHLGEVRAEWSLAEAKAEVERLKAERDEAWDRVDNLEGVIRDNIPYAYDQGEQDEDEANPEECVEYAAKEIADLKKANERLRGIVEVNDRRLAAVWDEARAKVERLRSAISRFVAQYPWQDGPEIQELKALKERE